MFIDHSTPFSQQTPPLTQAELEAVRLPDENGDYTHILIPIRMVKSDHAAVAIGLRIAASCEATLTILRVEPVRELPNPMHWLDGVGSLYAGASRPSGMDLIQSHKKANDLRKAQTLEFLRDECSVTPARLKQLNVEFREGDYANEIVRFADLAAADLIILPTESSILGLPIWPATVRHVLRSTQKAVMIVHPGTTHNSSTKNTH